MKLKRGINNNKTNKQMGYISSVYDQISLAYSIIGLTLVVPSVFIFKQYNRFLDHLQIVFLFTLMLQPNNNTFGSHLKDSWAQFIPNFLKFCTNGDLVCSLGFALSWTICLVGVILVFCIIVAFEKRRRPQLRFQPVYSFFKGFFKWTYIALAFFSLSYLITDIQAGTKTNLIPSIVILSWTVLFPIVQLIYYKVIQEKNDNIWIKWFQFFGYVRQFLIVLIFVLSSYIQTKTTIAKYFVYGPLVLYSAIYMWKGIFIHRVVQRILFGIQQAIIITIFSLYLFDPTHIMNYELDFIGLSVILLIQFILIIVRLILRLVYGRVDDTQAVIPEESGQREGKQKLEGSNAGNESNAVMVSMKDISGKKRYKQMVEVENLIQSKDSHLSSIQKGNSRRRG